MTREEMEQMIKDLPPFELDYLWSTVMREMQVRGRLNSEELTSRKKRR